MEGWSFCGKVFLPDHNRPEPSLRTPPAVADRVQKVFGVGGAKRAARPIGEVSNREDSHFCIPVSQVSSAAADETWGTRLVWDLCKGDS